MTFNILIIDSKGALWERYGQYLTKKGLIVHIAKETSLVKNLCENHAIEVAIASYSTDHLKANLRGGKKLPLQFLLIHERDDKEAYETIIKAGADDVLPGNISPEELYLKVTLAKGRIERYESHLYKILREEIYHERNIKYHELQTPLFGIMSALEVLKERRNNIKGAQRAYLIRNAYRHSQRLFDQLEKLKKFQNLPHIHAIGEIQNGFSSLLSEQIMEKRMRRHVINVLEDFPIVFDRAHLIFIIQELLDNANKFRDVDAPVVINMQPHQLIIKNKQQFLTADSWIQIEPFNQINREVFEQQGFGLGLYLCKKLAEKNNASLYAYVDKEADFIVQLNFPKFFSDQD